MTIPLLTRRHENRASTADPGRRGSALLRLLRTPKFRNPLPHPARVAVIAKKFSGNHLRVFKISATDAMRSFRPEILAGTLPALRALDPSLGAAKAAVVFSTTPMQENERNWLWSRFQVPCFEQLLDAHDRVIAEECEAHCGLHALHPEAISGMLTSAECECGRTEPRLMSE